MNLTRLKLEALGLRQMGQLAQFSELSNSRENLFDRLVNKEENIAVVGLDSVGISLAIHMASKFKVIGFDENKDKIIQLMHHNDPREELDEEEFIGKDISFTFNSTILNNAKFYIIAAPTPMNKLKKPDLTSLKIATAYVARNLKKGDCVVFVSTVYPGCTEEVCVPILERISNLKFNEDFMVGYSSERMNPVDSEQAVTKIVSGSTEGALELITNVYESVVKTSVYKAPSLKVAEAAKVVENIQRDVNIGLMNELSQIFNVLDVNTNDVLRAAGTKRDFHNYFPGLGGSNNNVYPYYLIQKAKENRFIPKILERAVETNEGIIEHITSQIEIRLHEKLSKEKTMSILVKGIAIKENVKNIRNSKAAKLCLTLMDRGYNVVVEDPVVDSNEVKNLYGIEIETNPMGKFDVILLAVDHKEYNNLSYNDYQRNRNKDTIIFDVKGNKKYKFPKEIYMSL